MYVQRNNERVDVTTVAVEKQYYILVCVCMLARACVRACGYPGAWACACAYVHIALLIQHATSNAPYCDVICGHSGSTIFFDIINGTIFEKKKSDRT
jgi:hypothetical protein